MLLAELEVYHSRPAQPTRRIALGHLMLPIDPPPGVGGLLLGAVAARFARECDSDDLSSIERLLSEVADGVRIVQPRLRHRYQVDRHGLAMSRHRLCADGDDLNFEFDEKGSAMSQVLGALAAIERLEMGLRLEIAAVVRRGLRWRGPIGPALIGYLAGSQHASIAALADPRGWALERLGFTVSDVSPSTREISRRYRQRMRDVHPDHGGDAESASGAIRELAEARRILSSQS